MHGACMGRAALPSRFLLLLADVIAGPQQRFVLGKPVAECVALVAAPHAADQALLRRAGQPAQQRGTVRRVTVVGPLFQNCLLVEPLGSMIQDVNHFRPGVRRARRRPRRSGPGNRCLPHSAQ
jgi:hypothetical protein